MIFEEILILIRAAITTGDEVVLMNTDRTVAYFEASMVGHVGERA